MRFAVFTAIALMSFAVPPVAWAQPKGGPIEPGTAAALLAGDEWERFCERVKQAGRIVLSDGVPANEIDRAEGYRYLLGMLAESIDVALYRTDLDDPQLRYHITKYRGEAMPSSDARYLRAEIDGQGVYRMAGKLGSAAHITLQVYSGARALESFELQPVADADGRFAITIGGPPRDANWMRISPQAAMIQFREYFSDWDAAVFSELTLERLDRRPRGEPLTAARMVRALDDASESVVKRVPFWKTRLDQIRATHDNSLSPARALGDVGLAGLLYGDGWFDLEEDEALIIELDPPEAAHWSFQLGNYWGEWLDFANYTSSTNGHQARPSSDGIYRLVIARSDPGVPNWLDTAGHREGVIVYRYHKAQASPLPKTRLVKLSQLRALLPPDTPVVDADERRAEIDARRAHKARRWQP